MNTNKHELLHKELSYEIQGAAIEVRKSFGSGLKEILYQNAFAEELDLRKLSYEREKAIKIYSPKTNKYMGLYRPDFVIDDRVLVEIKAVTVVPKLFVDQIYSYLRNSIYKLGYFINFSSPKLYVKRIILTNDRKSLRNLLVFISAVFVSFCVCTSASAAVLYAGSAYETVSEGETFVIDWFLDTEEEIINTVSLNLQYTPDTLEVVDAGPGPSLLNLWIKPPAYSNLLGNLELTGGVSGGVNHDRVPLFRSVFRVKAAGSARITMSPDSRLLLHDGRGTPTNLTFTSLNFIVTPAGFAPVEVTSPTHSEQTAWFKIPSVIIKFVPKPGEDYSYSFSSNLEIIPDELPDEVTPELSYDNLPDGIYYFKLNSRVGQGPWQIAGIYRVQIDTTAPESFQPLVASEPTVFGGEKFLSFSTVDKTSGISHYEVKQGWFGRYKEAQSPFQLTKSVVGDQVAVKAVDQAGNERVETMAFPGLLTVKQFLLLAIVLLILPGLIIWKRMKRKA